MKDLTSFTLSVVQELEDRERFGTAHGIAALCALSNVTGKPGIRKKRYG